jgi:hypothetical protein
MYLLDANTFIEAKNRYYGFDFAPAFWDWLIDANARGLVGSVARVEEELRDGGDDLADWVRERGDGFFLRPDDLLVASLQRTSTWVTNHQQYEQAAKATFLQGADYHLVAHAHANTDIVVTLEVPRPDARRSIKIPDVCDAMDVEWMTPFEMLRALEARFVNQAPNL